MLSWFLPSLWLSFPHSLRFVRFLPLFQSSPSQLENKISVEAKINSSKTHTILMESLLQRPWNPHNSMHQNTLRAWLLKENLTFFYQLRLRKNDLSPHTLTSRPKNPTSLSQACPPPPRRCMPKFMVVSLWNHQCPLKELLKKNFSQVFFKSFLQNFSAKDSPKYLWHLLDRNLPNTSHLTFTPPRLQMSRNLSPKQRKRQTSH